MIKIEFNSPLNYGETVYFIRRDKVRKGTLIGVNQRDIQGETKSSYLVDEDKKFFPTLIDEVFTSQEELFKAIMLKEDTDEKEAIGK